ncbi:hypothetical protein HY030_00750 [Candidatus Gottesmanbacteria bacterium]|nr:hypothetical protein [Candidatus Gottesmanbacteria bacterium]
MIFAAGLAIPFLLTALLIGVAFRYLQKLHKYLHVISVLGGVLLIIIGLFLLTGNFGRWISLFYGLFRFINYDKILNYL